MAQRWLVQVDASGVEGIARPADRREYYPAVDRKGQEPPAEGDPVVLWEMGTGATAGAAALGYFTGPPVDKEHPVSWARPDDTRTQRLSRRIEFTHMFEGPDKITRQTLKTDPRFDGWSFFRPGGALGPNPYPLTNERYDAIVERVPVWAELAAADDVMYDVILAAVVAPGTELRDGLLALREALKEDSEALIIEVVRSDGEVRDDVDIYVMHQPHMVENDIVVAWTTQQVARTAFEACLAVLDAVETSEGLLNADQAVLSAVQTWPSA